MDDDFLLAIQLQEQFDNEFESSKDHNFGHQSSKKRKIDSGSGGDVFPYSHQSATAERPMSIVDEAWETLDPIPDVRAIFLEFNDTFFWGKLCGVEVKWSPRMTLCAGVCSYEGRGGLCSIRLSEPLLKLRPRRDLVQTLLHEMIHALLFVTQNNRDRDGHGPEFCKHMERINKATGTKITVYHTFNDEVDLYRQHWWRCDGPCQNRQPYFGYVKRAMNRAPSSLDPWWGDHQRACGGAYIKVKEPEGYRKKSKTKSSKEKKKPENRMSPFSQPTSKTTRQTTSQPTSKSSSQPTSKSSCQFTCKSSSQPTSKSSSSSAASGSQDIRNIIPFSGKGFLLGGTSSCSSSSSSSKKPPPDHSLSQPKRNLLLTPPAKPSARGPLSPLSPPAKPSVRGPLSPLSPGQGSPDRKGSIWAPPSISGVTRDQKQTFKRSISNTKVFVNINGSPVRIPKASVATTGSKPSSTERTNELLHTATQRSVKDLFSSSTSADGVMTSEPPEEIKEEEWRSAEEMNSKQQTNTKTNSPLGAWLQSRPRSAITTGPKLSPTKPSQTRYPSGGSHQPSSTISGSGAGSRPGVGPALVSRKRPWDNGNSSHMFDFFQKKVDRESSSSSSSSSGSREVKARVSASTGASGLAAQQRGADPSSVQLKNAAPTSSSSSSSSFSSSSSMATLSVSCPVCQAKVQEAKINQHLDSCLS